MVQDFVHPQYHSAFKARGVVFPLWTDVCSSLPRLPAKTKQGNVLLSKRAAMAAV